jgi:uncharacterized transporter YbjL
MCVCVYTGTVTLVVSSKCLVSSMYVRLGVYTGTVTLVVSSKCLGSSNRALVHMHRDCEVLSKCLMSFKRLSTCAGAVTLAVLFK